MEMVALDRKGWLVERWQHELLGKKIHSSLNSEWKLTTLTASNYPRTTKVGVEVRPRSSSCSLGEQNQREATPATYCNTPMVGWILGPLEANPPPPLSLHWLSAGMFEQSPGDISETFPRSVSSLFVVESGVYCSRSITDLLDVFQ